MFVDLTTDMKTTFADRFLKFQVQVSGQPPQQQRRPPTVTERKPDAQVAESDLMVGAGAARQPQGAMQATHGAPGDAPARPVERSMPKVGRNDPCPCGSGKKYKKCHGAGA